MDEQPAVHRLYECECGCSYSTSVELPRSERCPRGHVFTERDWATRQPLPEQISRLEAALAAARAEIAKLTRHVEIIQTALNRYLPCPDHRDKVERGGRCLVCRAESARRDALREAAEELAVFRVEWAQAGAAWLRTKAEETG